MLLDKALVNRNGTGMTLQLDNITVIPFLLTHLSQFGSNGSHVKYLPSYSPELNLIEILWRFIKYYWLPFSAYTSFQSLCKAVEDILTHFGTDYTITFQAA